MIIPSIDLMNGKAVQLRQGKTLVLEAADVTGLAARFALYGDIAVIDLDAAMNRGSNADLIRALCRRFPCRVGGGIRDVELGRLYLKAGARKIIIGTKAEPDFLKQFKRDLLIAAVDARQGEVVDKGWTAGTGEAVLDRVRRLTPYCSEFLFTQVESEGMLGGINLERVAQVRAATGNAVTAAGGITTVDDIAALEKLHCNAQIGMAIYTGAMKLDDALLRLVDFSKGLVPTVVQDERGQVLMLAFSSAESLRLALHHKRGTYFSRSRNSLWTKGDTSGHVQELLRVAVDCDGDALRFTVRQTGPACHREKYSCFGERQFDVLHELFAMLKQRKQEDTGASYTAKLFRDPALLKEKLREEAGEVAEFRDRANLVWEAGDLLYFLTVLLTREGVAWEEVLDELKGRMKD